MVNLSTFLAILSLFVSAVVVISCTLQYISTRQHLNSQLSTIATIGQQIKAAEDLEFPRYEDLRTEISKLKSENTRLKSDVDALEDRIRILQARVAATVRHSRQGKEEQPATDEIDKMLSSAAQPESEPAAAHRVRRFGQPI